MQLTLSTKAAEEGDEEPTIFAAASDFFNTVDAFLEPMDSLVTVTPASAWQTMPFGTTDPFVNISPLPTTVDVSGISSLPLPPDIGDNPIPEPRTINLMVACVLGLLYRRRRSN